MLILLSYFGIDNNFFPPYYQKGIGEGFYSWEITYAVELLGSPRGDALILLIE